MKWQILETKIVYQNLFWVGHFLMKKAITFKVVRECLIIVIKMINTRFFEAMKVSKFMIPSIFFHNSTILIFYRFLKMFFVLFMLMIYSIPLFNLLCYWLLSVFIQRNLRSFEIWIGYGFSLILKLALLSAKFFIQCAVCIISGLFLQLLLFYLIVVRFFPR